MKTLRTQKFQEISIDFFCRNLYYILLENRRFLKFLVISCNFCVRSVFNLSNQAAGVSSSTSNHAEGPTVSNHAAGSGNQEAAGGENCRFDGNQMIKDKLQSRRFKLVKTEKFIKPFLRGLVDSVEDRMLVAGPMSEKEKDEYMDKK